MPAPTDERRMAICSPGLLFMVSTSVIHVISLITTHLQTQKGWKAELAWWSLTTSAKFFCKSVKLIAEKLCKQ